MKQKRSAEMDINKRKQGNIVRKLIVASNSQRA
jgi:hypothetical protein